ncbi:MAG: gamma-glutamylcyclotransferase [Hyphomicrobiaceae bacterium]|nr:gamma-glutamylcyclotransferase [Hyphomicrobiaceae bacterium]
MRTGHAGDLWVFGYGSLMWRPDFPFLERARATIAGYHRAFCVASTMHRGTKARPGLVLGLDQGRSCTGVAYRVAASDAEAVVAYLRRRELIYGVYRESHVPALLEAGASTAETLALAYTVERLHPSYQGVLSLADQARIIRGARGQSGANLDYLINTVRHLQELGIRERRLERLMAIAAAHAANVADDTQHRPSVAALRKTWAHYPAPDVRIPIGDQRRFGHRQRLTGG